MNFRTTLSLLQVNKNFVFNEAFSHFKDKFSNFRKVLENNYYSNCRPSLNTLKNTRH